METLVRLMAQYYFNKPKHIEIDMLVLGKTGTGKSSTGNSILGRKVFKSTSSSTSVTTCIKSGWSEYTDDDLGHYVLKVTDGPGLEDTNLNHLQDKRRAYTNIAKILSECPRGIHAFIVVIRYGTRFTTEDKTTLEALKEILGKDFLANFGVVVITGGDQPFDDPEDDKKPMTFQDWCGEQTGALKKVMEECNNRFVLFNNTTKDEALLKEQRNTLLRTVFKIMSKNKGERYTNETFKKCEESHKQLLSQCGLTCVREEFRKQLSILEGKVKEIASRGDAKIEADERLQTLLEQVEHEITVSPRMEYLKKDLSELEQFLTAVKELKEKDEPCDGVLKEATSLCEKMIKAASPPEMLEFFEDMLSVILSSDAPLGIRINPLKYPIAGISAMGSKLIKLATKLDYHY